MPSIDISQVKASTTHESAHLHVSGQAQYIDDIPELEGTLHAALGMSTQAHAHIIKMDLSAVLQADGVVAVLTAKDIPHANEWGAIIADEPILADKTVEFFGQPLFMVLAESHDQARRAARLAKIDYEALPAIFSLDEAHQAKNYVVKPLALACGEAESQLNQAPLRRQSRIHLGGQEQFYLEGQISYAMPQENHTMDIQCSTQHPSEMQHLVAHMLGWDLHRIRVICRRMGGGFGGKESQSGQFACCAALGAWKLQRPVKLRLDRDDDMMMTGKRHDFIFDYDVGFDKQGYLKAAKVNMLSRAGFSADLSAPVMTRALCHFDNTYYLEHLEAHGYCCKTNTQSNTAFRGFGGPQGAFAMEYILDDIARELNLDALEVRKRNFYGQTERNTTPYGQKVEDNVIHELVEQLEKSSDYQVRRTAIREFNQQHHILKKGIALTPLKFGISFNVVHFNQAGALVHIYRDGSILLNHGGTEMGQGLNTKVAQVVANELGVSLARIQISATDTHKIANTSATAASTGTDLNGKAAQDAARQIKRRLCEMITQKYAVEESQIHFENDKVRADQYIWSFEEIIAEAYVARVQLWSDGFYKTPKLHWDPTQMKGRPFFYYAYGASVSEVIVDTLTGEWVLLRTDILHDAGQSINPDIDKGQIEGGFIQGMGWLTSEELCWNAQGKLTTHAPSTYKIPSVNDCPHDFRVNLFQNKNVEDSILRSKAVGEPPLLLPFSVFFAIREAIASIGEYKINPPLRAPATAESIYNAIQYIKSKIDKA